MPLSPLPPPIQTTITGGTSPIVLLVVVVVVLIESAHNKPHGPEILPIQLLKLSAEPIGRENQEMRPGSGELVECQDMMVIAS